MPFEDHQGDLLCLLAFEVPLSEMVDELFPYGMTLPILEYTRRSVIIGDYTITCRPVKRRKEQAAQRELESG